MAAGGLCVGRRKLAARFLSTGDQMATGSVLYLASTVWLKGNDENFEIEELYVKSGERLTLY